MRSFSSKELASFFHCFGMSLESSLVSINKERNKSRWILRWNGVDRSFLNLQEASDWANRLLVAPMLNEEIYLTVTAYFDSDDEERSEIMEWLNSGGESTWGMDGYVRRVEKRKTRMSVRNFPRAFREGIQSLDRFGLQGGDLGECLPESAADASKSPWHQDILMLIRNEEFKRLRAELPLASGESRPASRL